MKSEFERNNFSVRTAGRTRRSVLNGLAATAAVPALSRAAGVTSMAAAQAAPPISVTLLGTGTPQPRPDRFGPSILVEAGGTRLVFDAGRGLTIRLFQLGIPLGTIKSLFITHFTRTTLTACRTTSSRAICARPTRCATRRCDLQARPALSGSRRRCATCMRTTSTSEWPTRKSPRRQRKLLHTSSPRTALCSMSVASRSAPSAAGGCRFTPVTVAPDGVVTITPAQLGYLLEGIDWRLPQHTWRPQAAG